VHLGHADVIAERITQPEVDAVWLLRWLLGELDIPGRSSSYVFRASNVVKKRWPPDRPATYPDGRFGGSPDLW
jgi:hypothetical protein